MKWFKVGYADRINYSMLELFHKASVFGKKENLYEVELALGTMRVFTFEVLVKYGFCRTVIGASGKYV